MTTAVEIETPVKGVVTKLKFLLANRNLGFMESAFSIAATWIWAPALFVSAQKAYQQGIVGLFWFLAPNVLCLILFAFFISKLRVSTNSEYTLSDYMRANTSDRVQNVYWVALVGLTVCAFAVQLLAGGKLLAQLLSLPYPVMTVILTMIPLSYSMIYGLKVSVLTDYVKMLVIVALGLFLIPSVIHKAGGIDIVLQGLGGKSGQFTNLFDASGLKVFLTFGIPVTIGLISGPFGDQSFWQRGFAIKQSEVKKSFITGAFIFGLVPLMMGLVGFLAAGLKLPIKDPQMVNLEVITALLPGWGVACFIVMVFAGLTSILDSKFCSMASISGHDMVRRFFNDDSDEFSLKISRWGMVVLSFSAIAIANIPGLKILHLFLFYGTLRSSTLLPTILTINKVKLSEKGVFYGMILSLFLGLPIFAYGNLNSLVPYIVGGSLFTVLTPGILGYLLPKK
jgi:Na+/proline symporter